MVSPDFRGDLEQIKYWILGGGGLQFTIFLGGGGGGGAIQFSSAYNL